jgi:elongation factor P hydroxylase
MTKLKTLLAELKKLDAEATEGPWEHVYKDGEWESDLDQCVSLSAGYWWDIGHLPLCDNQSGKIKPDKDAKFIAQSRTMTPKLIKVIEKLVEQRNTMIITAFAATEMDWGNSYTDEYNKEIE